jgi:predicted HTH transcriptional regulator
MGFIIPETALFFSQFNSLYIITAIPLILFFLSLLSLFFIYRYKEKHKLSDETVMLRLIAKGESCDLEFKSSLRWDYRENTLNKKLEEVIMKSIAAFANGQGGTLLIGVDDEGAILGLSKDYKTLKQENKDAFELHLRNLVSSMYGTFAIDNIEVRFIDVLGEEICCINISPSREPLYTSMKNKNGDKQEQFYIRDGNMSRRIESLREIMEYCSKRFK